MQPQRLDSRVRRVLVTLSSVMAFSVAATWSTAQQKQKFPDGTPIACNFTWTLLPGNGPGDARDCGGYHFRLIRELGVEFDTLTIAASETQQELTYRVAQIPVTRPETGTEAPTVLLDRNGQLTRVVVIRRTDRINIAVGETPFIGAPPGRIRPM